MNKHFPCGHWHKKEIPICLHPITSEKIRVPHSCYQSIDLYVYGSEVFVFFPLWEDLDPNGTLSLVWDSAGRVYIAGQGMVNYSESPIWSMVEWDTEIIGVRSPGAEVVNDTYYAVAGTDFYDPDGWATYIWIYRNELKYRKKLFYCPDMNDHEYYIYGGGTNFSMNAMGDIVIPCSTEDHVNDTRGTRVAVSHDYGNTFNEVQVFTFNYTTYKADFWVPFVVEDANGIIWLVVGYRRTLATAVYKFLIYKSTDKGDSWSYVNEIITNSESAAYPMFYIDGTDLYIGAKTEKKIYKSTDNGVTFNLISTFPDTYFYGFGVNNGVICALTCTTDYTIKRSVDGGGSYSTVKTMAPGGGGVGYAELDSRGRFRHRGDVWVFTSYEFNKDDLLLFLISYDNGVTWEDIPSTVTYYEDIAYAEQFTYG